MSGRKDRQGFIPEFLIGQSNAGFLIPSLEQQVEEVVMLRPVLPPGRD